MVSIEGAADTLIPEVFMENEEDYDAWFQAKVTRTLDAFKSGKTNITLHEDAMERALQKLQAKVRPVSE